MSTKFNVVLALSLLALNAFGCATAGDDLEDADEEAVGEARQALERQNSMEMNGTVLNGTFLNGVRQNGVRQNGVRQNGVRQNGTGLVGVDADTGLVIKSGVDFAGADMDGDLGDGTPVALHIDSVSTSEVPGISTYVISMGGLNVCAGGVSALVFPGVWDYATGAYIDDPNNFTVACRGAGIAKCAEWGYNDHDKWTESNGGSSHDISLNYFHQACVRMVRADYCGDGHSHTVTGTLIDVWDAKGLQAETANSGLDFEAEWTATGANCVRHTRWATGMYGDVQSYITSHCDSVWAGSDRPTANAACGSSSSDFFSANGYSKTAATRPFLRNSSTQH